ncbi:MAG: sugar transferase [Longimicrobiales bacterium]|nr:sugar transferase [Longimicrobiales bacterium]
MEYLLHPSAFSDAPSRCLPRERVRRILNVLVALIGIVLTIPVMILLAILVKLDSPGPVLFTQPRVGIDRRSGPATERDLARRRFDAGGRLFRIYKFRTMTVSEANPTERWASPEDPRITRLGRILRLTRLDELPQLFNVLRGEMNVVGPRPEQPTIFVELRDELSGYSRRQSVLPGITGLAQVNNGYDQSLDDVRRKLAYDLDYISARSTTTDLGIMLRTFPVMVLKIGAI